MEARVTLSPKTAKQSSTITQMLLWIQNNPRHCRNTNITRIANTMTGPGTACSRKQILQKMVTNQIIHRHGGKRRATFTINYLHTSVLPEVLINAPKEEQNRVERIKKGLKSNQHISQDGCVVTTQKKEEAPKQIKVKNAVKEEAQLIPVKIKKSNEGINLTITLNINL